MGVKTGVFVSSFAGGVAHGFKRVDTNRRGGGGAAEASEVMYSITYFAVHVKWVNCATGEIVLGENK